MKILFICHGNVGRSQIAEAYYNHFTKSFDASSAGVDPEVPKIWKTVTPEILQIMREENIDISSSKVKYVTEEMVNVADRIIILCKKEDCPDFVLKHPSIYWWKTEDPKNVSTEKLRSIRNQIRLKVYELLKVY